MGRRNNNDEFRFNFDMSEFRFDEDDFFDGRFSTSEEREEERERDRERQRERSNEIERDRKSVV